MSTSTSLNLETRVQEVLEHYPAARDVLHRYGMDTCCGSHLPLEKAARGVGVDPHAVLRELVTAVGGEVVRPEEVPPELRPVWLDNRGLEPPEPMVRVLAALKELDAGEYLDVRNDREPLFLYPHLEKGGYSYQAQEQADGSFIVAIWPEQAVSDGG